MINDYAGYYATVADTRTHRLSRRKVARNALTVPTSALTKKIASAMVVLTLILGFSSTFWYGLQINAALNTVGDTKAIQQELSMQHTQLETQLQNLRTPEQMTQAAGRLALRLPATGQVRTP